MGTEVKVAPMVNGCILGFDTQAGGVVPAGLRNNI